MDTASRRSAVLPLAVGLFAAGLLAVLAVFASFAAGVENLPLWLNLATLLAPAGLIVGVVGAVLRTRRG
ncbi:hypothetical protein ABZ805_04010 [Saccharopolyspora sp. NPDC047091]|uniref:hypothetical protein n=1 Tax=Saccharopolyspora sp. NPDC047091 TaxID=3155924 RepID=UPI0033FE89B5